MSVSPSTKGKKFRLYGYPVLHSASPAFHNEIFGLLGEGKHYTTFSTTQVIPEMLQELRSDDVGGSRYVHNNYACWLGDITST